MCILISIEDTTTFQRGYTNLDLLHILIIITMVSHIWFISDTQIVFCILIIVSETENLLKDLF